MFDSSPKHGSPVNIKRNGIGNGLGLLYVLVREKAIAMDEGMGREWVGNGREW